MVSLKFCHNQSIQVSIIEFLVAPPGFGGIEFKRHLNHSNFYSVNALSDKTLFIPSIFYLHRCDKKTSIFLCRHYFNNINANFFPD